MPFPSTPIDWVTFPTTATSLLMYRPGSALIWLIRACSHAKRRSPRTMVVVKYKALLTVIFAGLLFRPANFRSSDHGSLSSQTKNPPARSCFPLFEKEEKCVFHRFDAKRQSSKAAPDQFSPAEIRTGHGLQQT